MFVSCINVMKVAVCFHGFHCPLSHFAFIDTPTFPPQPSIKTFSWYVFFIFYFLPIHSGGWKCIYSPHMADTQYQCKHTWCQTTLAIYYKYIYMYKYYPHLCSKALSRDWKDNITAMSGQEEIPPWIKDKSTLIIYCGVVQYPLHISSPTVNSQLLLTEAMDFP